jgi:phosphoribosylglycinamide formyltransferase-1
VIGVLVSGEGTNLQALIDAGLPIVAVASNNPRARGLDRARAAGVRAATFSLDEFPDRTARDTAMAAWLGERGVELVVLAGYMHLLTQPFLERFPDRIVNVHPSLLPDFPGAHAVEEQLAAGVSESGTTIHLVDEGVDSGAILRQEHVPVLAGDTAETLHERIKELEHRVLPEVVRTLISASRGVAGGAAPEGTVRRSTDPEGAVPPAAPGGGEAAEATPTRSREMNSRSLGPAGAAAAGEPRCGR